MAGYTDNLVLYIGAETQDEASAADVLDVEFPTGGVVYEFGLIQTELASGNAPVVALDLSSSAAESDRTEQATITPSTTQAAGSRVRSSSSKFPLNVPHGGRVTLEHKTAGTAAGAYKPYIIAKHSGVVAISTTASPVTEVAA
ncbi:MAG TPA: hypothetical protein VF406_18820 [Thermodesulfobacteriota bacterium]